MLLVLAPVFRYSYWRDAWILRAVGEERGPVLVRRSRRTGHTGLESRLARTLPLPALVLLGALVTVAVGFVLARTVGGGSGRLERTAYSPSGLFQVSVPRGWRAQAKPTGGPRGITDEISLQPEDAVDGVLILGRFGTNEPDAARRSLLGSAAGAARPQTVTLAGAQFTRYVAAPSSVSPYVARSVSVLRTSLGMIVALCLTDVSGPAFTANCERVLASVRVSSRALGRSLPPSYAAHLASALKDLNAARTAGASGLAGARDATRQANVAELLARAHSTAAARLRGLSAGPAAQASAAIVAALGTTSRAYDSLARAAAENDPQAYANAKAFLQRSQAALKSALLQTPAVRLPRRLSKGIWPGRQPDVSPLR